MTSPPLTMELNEHGLRIKHLKALMHCFARLRIIVLFGHMLAGFYLYRFVGVCGSFFQMMESKILPIG